jgi:hypothetical protein
VVGPGRSGFLIGDIGAIDGGVVADVGRNLPTAASGVLGVEVMVVTAIRPGWDDATAR